MDGLGVLANEGFSGEENRFMRLESCDFFFSFNIRLQVYSAKRSSVGGGSRMGINLSRWIGYKSKTGEFGSL